MQRLALALMCALVLAGCGGGSRGVLPSAGSAPQNVSKHAMATPTCAPAWQDGGTYTAGQMVSYNPGSGTHNYTALVNQTDWTGAGWNPTVGSLYSDDGACGGSSTSTPAPTPTPTKTATPKPSTTPSATPKPTATPTSGGAGCWAAWNSSTAYNGGAQVSYNGENYQAAYWTQNNEPDTNSGPAGSGQPWIPEGSCGGGGSTPTPTPTHTASPTPQPTPTSGGGGGGGGTAPGFIFSPYKDITVGMNWNTDQLMSNGALTYQNMPSGDSTMDWAFATGTCGSENWAGVAPTGTPSLVSGNVSAWAGAGKKYIIATGGANGSFLCPSTSGFLSFINTYVSSSMIGVDFDIESGQTSSDVAALVADVKAAEGSYPGMRFSFTVATLGGSVGLPSGGEGDTVVKAIQSAGLGGNYTVDLMAMDYGSATTQNCVIVSGQCEMGQSAVQAAVDLHNTYGIPYSHIEICPMVGANDTAGEDFTLADADTVASFVKSNGVAGVHFWSYDRDSGLSYTNRFISDGL